MMTVVPAVGVAGLELLQDTLKSMLVAGFALAAAAVFFWRGARDIAAPSWHGVLLLPALLALYALGSMAWSHTYLGGVEAIRWVLFGLILFLGMNTLTTGRVTLLAWGIHLGAALAALWAALQFWVNLDFFAQGPNPASTFINRNVFAEYLVCTLPFSALLLSRVKTKGVAYLLTVSIGFNIVALLMTGTRSALLGLFLLLLLLPCILWRYRDQAASGRWHAGHLGAIVLVLLATVAGLGSLDSANPKLIAEFGPGDALDRSVTRSLSMTQASEYTEGSFSVRALMWKSTLRMIAANPVAGVGAGAWEVHAPLYQEPGSQVEIDFFAHNEFLQLLAEYGLVGWLFLGLLFAYLSWAAYRTWSDPSERGRQEAPARALALASLLVMLLVSNAGFPWRIATTGALFALSLAILAASDCRLAPAPRFFPSGSFHWSAPDAKVALAVTLGCAVLAAYISQQAVLAEAKLVRAGLGAALISRSSAPDHSHWDAAKVLVLKNAREGIALNPHYRRLTPVIALELAGWGDWPNAIWILESVMASRPHVVALIALAGRGYLLTGDEHKALELLNRALQLQPTAPIVRALQADLLIHQSRYPQAAQVIEARMHEGWVDDDLINSAYVLGLRTRRWDLVIRALELRIKSDPKQAATAWMHLGNLYSRADVGNEPSALESYRMALRLTPAYLKDSLWRQIPPALQQQLAP